MERNSSDLESRGDTPDILDPTHPMADFVSAITAQAVSFSPLEVQMRQGRLATDSTTEPGSEIEG